MPSEGFEYISGYKYARILNQGSGYARVMQDSKYATISISLNLRNGQGSEYVSKHT